MKDVVVEERIDRNGTKHQVVETSCDRCGGHGGADVWKFTGYTCFKCGGSGRMLEKRTVYTPEYEAKLEAQREKRAAKKEAEVRATAAVENQKDLEKWGYTTDKIYMVLGNTFNIKDELKAKGARFNNQIKGWFFNEKPEDYETAELEVKQLINYDYLGRVSMKWEMDEVHEYVQEQIKKATKAVEGSSEYVGEIREKIDANFKFISSFRIEFETNYNYGTTVNYINKMQDENGNIFIWKTTKDLAYYVTENNMIHLKGSIKEHSEYNEIKQTILTRCKVVE